MTSTRCMRRSPPSPRTLHDDSPGPSSLMAWEDLQEDLADLFSGLQARDARDQTLHLSRRFQGSGSAAEARRIEAERMRRRRRRAWAQKIASGVISATCQRPGCSTPLPVGVQRGAPRRFCSRACKDWRQPQPATLRQCAAPGCTAQCASKTCSNRCRQRLWYWRHRAQDGTLSPPVV